MMLSVSVTIGCVKWISSKKLQEEMKNAPEIFCPWMLIALVLLDKSKKETLEKYQKILFTWINDEMKENLLEAISKHLPDNQWRLLNETI